MKTKILKIALSVFAFVLAFGLASFTANDVVEYDYYINPFVNPTVAIEIENTGCITTTTNDFCLKDGFQRYDTRAQAEAIPVGGLGGELRKENP